MAFVYDVIDGQKVNRAAAVDYRRLEDAFRQRFGLDLLISSGTRTYEEQLRLYNDYISGRSKVRAAAPWDPQAYHVETNPRGPRAIDIRDSGGDDGVTRYGNVRSDWINANAERFNFVPRGYREFSEPWHLEWQGTLATDSGGSPAGAPYDQKVLLEQQFLNAARGESLVADGIYGTATKAAYERYQTFLNTNGYAEKAGVYPLVVDGQWGNNTQAAHAIYYAEWTQTQFPKFPLPAGYYFGPADGPEESISGLYSYKGALTPWQQRMKDRGWPIDPDGVYGPQTAAVATAFQKEKNLTVDGKIGPQTWDAAWTAPITAPVPAEPVPDIPTNPKTPDNPRGLPVRPVAFYPGAYISLEAPLGVYPRGTGYADKRKVPVVIDQFHLHRTGTNGDDGDWFSYVNSRGSCPHLHVRADARVREFIRPLMKPCLTGPDWNWRGYGIEIQGAGDGTEAQFERVADIMAWLASFEGKELDGVPVTYNLRQESNTVTDSGRTNTHREMIPGTECPGDWWQSKIHELLVRARVILAEKYSQAPDPDPDPDPDPEEPVTYTVPKAEYDAWLAELDKLNETAKGFAS